jgi:hypothetical protein
MLFDQVRELPVATLRRAPGSRLALFAGDLQRWWIARWQWFRPRTVPVLVAFLGMLGVIQAVNYLSHPPPSDQVSAQAELDPAPMGEPGPQRVHLVARP